MISRQVASVTTIQEYIGEDKMTSRPAALVAAVIVASLPTTTLKAQATDPPYLSQMPAVDRVMAEIKGPDAMDTAARQMGAFWQLQKMVEELAGDRRWRNQLTSDEGTLLGQYRYGYELANKPYAHITYAPSHPDKPAWFKLYNFYLHDAGLLDEMLQRFFSPEFRTAYFQASGKQPQTPLQSTPPDAVNNPTEPTGTALPCGVDLLSDCP